MKSPSTESLAGDMGQLHFRPEVSGYYQLKSFSHTRKIQAIFRYKFSCKFAGESDRHWLLIRKNNTIVYFFRTVRM